MLVWACEDDEPQIAGPEGIPAEAFTDPRDGKSYRCVTIGGQTWMAENLAYRLPYGSVDGCFTYREDFVDTSGFEVTFEAFEEEVGRAVEDGRISGEPLDAFGTTIPMLLGMVEMYAGYGGFDPKTIGGYIATVNMIRDWGYDIQSAVDLLESFPDMLKVTAIQEAIAGAMRDAEEYNDGYSGKYGYLYTWDGALAALEKLPEGWRLPTDEDWQELERTLAMDPEEIGRLEEWRGVRSGVLLKEEKTGFGIRFGGTRAYGNFGDFGSPYMNKDMNAYFWSSTRIAHDDSTRVAVVRGVSRVYDGILRGLPD